MIISGNLQSSVDNQFQIQMQTAMAENWYTSQLGVPLVREW